MRQIGLETGGVMASKLYHLMREMRAQLEFAHPGMFSLEAPKPFWLGFRKELRLAHPDLNYGVMQAMLGWLTNRRAYLARCTLGAARFSFEGPNGTVTEDQAAHAIKRLGEREARAVEIRARIEAKKQAKAERAAA
jgi:sRNA-binding protein